MIDRTLPNWFRIVIVGTAVSQTFFGLVLLFNPSAIGDLWPWPMTPITTRVLAASTLVSVPLAVFAALVNRQSAARIPIVMLLTYRVFQLLAGLIHFERFDFSQFTSWNYFGGGSALMLMFIYVLARGRYIGRPVSDGRRYLPVTLPLELGPAARSILTALAGIFVVVGVVFLYLGPDAAPLWFEADGRLTPLTARLFGSPLIGLGLGIWLITRSSYWHAVAIPAAGMVTFGIAGAIAFVLGWGEIDPPSVFGYFIVALPLVLFAIGASLLARGRIVVSPATAPPAAKSQA
jgi:hypothetical protein